MAATYDPTLPTPRDELRFLIGDTSDPFFFTNEELDAVLAKTNGNIQEAGLLCALSGMARSKGASASISIGPMSISNESYDRWNGIYDMLVRSSARTSGLRAAPRLYGYTYDRHIGNGRPFHARVGIHDYVADLSRDTYAESEVYATQHNPMPYDAEPEQQVQLMASGYEAITEAHDSVPIMVHGGQPGEWTGHLEDGTEIEVLAIAEGDGMRVTIVLPSSASGGWVVSYNGTPMLTGTVGSNEVLVS